MKRREDSFFGLHLDIHADPGTSVDCIGEGLTEEQIRTLCRTVKPDFVQIDCKGHPGYASYPTAMGNAFPFIQGDPLALWRRVTAEEGVALYMHYSGVRDRLWCSRHPEDAVVFPDGKSSPEDTSVCSSYADRLLIPQLTELAQRYHVDGVWVDGECWACQWDFSPAMREEYTRETGKEAPVCIEGAPVAQEYRDFCREQFRRYLRRYTEAVHRACPGFQIASNWAFADHMPEAVCADVDFLSGDYDPQNSYNTARLSGRILAAQGLPWDLMAWNFRHEFTPGGFSSPKHPVQIMQEAAAVISLGGGFQNYVCQERNGSPKMKKIASMVPVAQFLRARQPYCHKGTFVPQAVLLNSAADRYATSKNPFSCDGYDNVRGLLRLLCDVSQSVEVREEHNLAGRTRQYPLIAVGELHTAMEPAMPEELVNYVKAGGNLLLTGANTLRTLAAAGLPCPVPDAPEADHGYFTVDGESYTGFDRPLYRLSAPAGAEIVAYASRSDEGKDAFPLAAVFPCGAGKIAAAAADLGSVYVRHRTVDAQRLIDRLCRMLYTPIAAPAARTPGLELSLLRKEGVRYLQLVNCGGPHADPTTATFDRIPPLSDVRLVLQSEKPPRLTLLPAGTDLTPVHTPAGWEVTVSRVEIHEILRID